MALENLNEIEKAFGLTDGQLVDMINSEEKHSLDLSELVIEPKSIYEERIKNIKTDSAVMAREVTVKKVRDAFGLEFQGKYEENLIEALKGRDEKIKSEVIKDPEERYTTLKSDFEKLQQNYNAERQKITDLELSYSQKEKENKIKGDLFKHIPDNVIVGKSTILLEAKEKGFSVYGSEEEMLSDPDIDVVLIATPNDCHKPIAIRAMHAGKNVISEKPVTLSSSDLQEMVNVAKETGKFLTVHQNRRWDDDFLIIRKLVEEQKLGHVFRIESRVHGSRGIPGDWRKEKIHGGGMVLDWGVHLLDQILYLYGNRKIETVYASLTHITNQEVDDGFTTILTFEGGTEVLVEVGTNNYISLPRWYVLGEDGTAVIRDWQLNGEIIRKTGITEEKVVPVKTAAGLTKTMAPRREDTIVKEELPHVSGDIADFHRNVAAVIRDGAEPEIKLFQVMRVMKLMEAIFQSAETNQVIDYRQYES